jgi:hypothetical protein
MPDTWTLTPTSVQKNGAAIVGFVAFALSVRFNTESIPFAETTLSVRIIDPHSEANREAPLAPLSAIEKTIVLGEYAGHPSFSEYRSKPGDTIEFAGTVIAGPGAQPGTLSGTGML